MTAPRYCGLTIGLLAVSQVPLLVSGSISSATKMACLLGGGLAAVNALAAYALVRWSAPRPMRVLIWAVFGGLTARLMLMLAALAVAIGVVGLPVVPLVVALAAYFALFLVLELIVLPRLFRVVTP
jgi:hypothetical protein